jgi:hypothetical protein
LSEVEFSARRELVLWSRRRTKDHLRIAFGVMGRPHKAANLEPLRKLLSQSSVKTVRLGRTEKRINNPLSVPIVRTVRVADPDEGPYFVEESGWWRYRGAQPSLADSGSDYCKVCLPPKSAGRIRRYGFLADLCRPGWGSQYQMALRDMRKTAHGGTVTARIASVTPAILPDSMGFTWYSKGRRRWSPVRTEPFF